MNATFVECERCGYETQQKELKNNGLEKEALCLACKTKNKFKLCEDCGEFYHIKKGCACKKGK
jgi:DNA replicative helicase MCM subunit Mcm2 (Cdc46/Mcm family)